MFLELKEITFQPEETRNDVDNYPETGLYLVRHKNGGIIPTKDSKELPDLLELLSINKENNNKFHLGILSNLPPGFEVEKNLISFEQLEKDLAPSKAEIQRLAMKDEDFMNGLKSDLTKEINYENERLMAEKQSQLLFSPEQATVEMISSPVVDQQFVLELSKILLNRS